MFGSKNLKLLEGKISINPLNAELNPIRHLPALVGARHIFHVSWIRVNNNTRQKGRNYLEK